MKKQFLLFLILMLSGLVPVVAEVSDTYVAEAAARQMLTWQHLPYQWNEGAFVGNGITGVMAYMDSLDHSLTLQLCRPDVTDHRKAPHSRTSLGVKDASVMFDFCRLDIGRLKLYLDGRILGGTMRQDIYQGIITGEITTNRGTMEFQLFTPIDGEVNVLRYKYRKSLRVQMIAGNPQSPRVIVFPEQKASVHYQDNPQPQVSQRANDGSVIQPLLAGGDYATYWQQQLLGGWHTVCVSTANAVPLSGVSILQARGHVAEFFRVGVEESITRLRQWRQHYMSSTFISIPDKKLENFYAIQMYKLATCSSPAGPAMDNFGTFFKMSQWPGMWWNLNVQLAYSSVYVNNKMPQGRNFQQLMDEKYLDILSAVDNQKLGDYGWALFNYTKYLLYDGFSPAEISRQLLPKLRVLLQRYRQNICEDSSSFTLVGMESPEYEGFKTYDNSNYNLAVLQWAVRTYLTYESPAAADYSHWQHLQAIFPPYPTDENGMMIARDKPLTKSHRHYSHLLGYYPLHVINVDTPANRLTLQKSLHHWLTIRNGRGLAGYSYTGASSLYSLLGIGDSAYAMLRYFINRPIGISLLLHNTMYVECDGKNPVIETPLSASAATAEMLLQSRDGIIRPFPAVPASWSTACFHQLRAEGAFIVSAQRLHSTTAWVSIRSEKGGICQLQVDTWLHPVVIRGRSSALKQLSPGHIILQLHAEEKIIIADSIIVVPKYVFAPALQSGCHYYGLKEGEQLSKQMDWR